MASTKVVTVLFNAETITAGAGDEVSALATLDDGYGAALHIKVTNGATGPTAACQIQIETSADNVLWCKRGGPLVAALGNDIVSSWGGIEIGIGVEYLRLQAGSNTDEDVVADADISEVTEL